MPSVDGKVFTWQKGSENYGQMGVRDLSGLNRIQALEGLKVQRVFAGYYSSLVIVDAEV